MLTCLLYSMITKDCIYSLSAYTSLNDDVVCNSVCLNDVVVCYSVCLNDVVVCYSVCLNDVVIYVI